MPRQDAGEEMGFCDGSAGVRFGTHASGGFLGPDDLFLAPIAYWFFFLRGDCQYVVTEGPSGEAREGTLTASEAADLAAAVSSQRFGAFDGYLDRDSCPDAGEVVLHGPSMRAMCTCGCDPSAPAGLEAAISAAHDALMNAWSAGRPLAGPVRAVAYSPPEGISWWPGALLPQDWTLATSLDSLSIGEAGMLTATSGSSFEGADAEALRHMRQIAHARTDFVQSFPVREPGGERTFALDVRDELPGELETEITERVRP